MENLGYLLQDDDIPQAVKRRSVKEKSKSVQLENVSKKYLFAKRAIDVILSFCAVAVLSVPMLLIALVVFLQDFHNPIFKQVRVTKDGRFFTMYKFRTMCVNAEQKLEELRSQNEADGPVFKMKKDPRVTPIGGFLRKTSLDELPQFFNVLKGDMSLVGPRPEVPYHVEHFKEEIPRYLVRQQVRPGCTGWAQIHGLRGDTDIAERIRYDIWYIENWTVALDIKIIFRTVFGSKMVNDEKPQ